MKIYGLGDPFGTDSWIKGKNDTIYVVNPNNKVGCVYVKNLAKVLLKADSEEVMICCIEEKETIVLSIFYNVKIQFSKGISSAFWKEL